MRFVNNKIRDAYFRQHCPDDLNYADETDRQAVKFIAMLTPEQTVALAEYMQSLCRLREEEQKWYFQHGWLEGQKSGAGRKTP